MLIYVNICNDIYIYRKYSNIPAGVWIVGTTTEWLLIVQYAPTMGLLTLNTHSIHTIYYIYIYRYYKFDTSPPDGFVDEPKMAEPVGSRNGCGQEPWIHLDSTCGSTTWSSDDHDVETTSSNRNFGVSDEDTLDIEAIMQSCNQDKKTCWSTGNWTWNHRSKKTKTQRWQHPMNPSRRGCATARRGSQCTSCIPRKNKVQGRADGADGCTRFTIWEVLRSTSNTVGSDEMEPEGKPIPQITFRIPWMSCSGRNIVIGGFSKAGKSTLALALRELLNLKKLTCNNPKVWVFNETGDETGTGHLLMFSNDNFYARGRTIEVDHHRMSQSICMQGGAPPLL